MINSAGQCAVSEIFSPEKDICYFIPRYQREYIWGKDQWLALWNDLHENEVGYFIGTIICINTKTDSLEPDNMELVDGQQRLTTISLILTAIYKRISEETEQLSDEFITEKTNLKNRLVLKNNKKKIRLTLSSQHGNDNDYQTILVDSKVLDKKIITNKHWKKEKIFKAFTFFKDKIATMDIIEVVQFLNKINKAMLVKIEVDNHADAFMLFESLNNRGMPLSVMDLVKNNLLASLDKRKQISMEDAYEGWVHMVDAIDDPADQERLLRFAYNIHLHKPEVKIKNIAKATRTNLINVYQRMIKRNAKDVYAMLLKDGHLFGEMLNPDEHGIMHDYQKGLLDLQHIGASQSHMLLLHLFEEHSDNQQLIHDSIKLLVSYFVRRSITGFPGTNLLDGIFISLVRHCAEIGDELTIDDIENFLCQPGRIAPNKMFRDRLLGDVYLENAWATRFILAYIEEHHQTYETKKDLWEKRCGKKYYISIEHIFPQGKNIPDSWIEMIADCDKAKAYQYREQYVHKLGNLTLTAFNSQLSNFDFCKKRDRTEKGNVDKFIGYQNGFYLNRFIKTKDAWTVDDIIDRTNFLVEETLQVFSMDVPEEFENEESSPNSIPEYTFSPKHYISAKVKKLSGKYYSQKIGEYSDEELTQKLTTTLTAISPNTPRIIVLLKLLLSEQRKFHREEIKQEFVNHKLASRSESGQRLSLVSQALTRAKNDHLRQILNFDSLGGEQGHPGAHKENYEIRKEYRGLVEKVLRFNK